MISFIICSIKPELYHSLTENIEETIGNVSYEFLRHDNRATNWGLAKVYNSLASKAKGDILCFIHEDIKVKTNNWGEELIKFLNSDTSTGVIGFAGSQIKTKHTSGWLCEYENIRENIIQHYPNKTEEHIYINPNNELFSEVLTLDGLALICRKDIWQKTRFDEQTFNGFHFYDLDFTLNVSKSHKNYVCNSILLEHFSSGSFKNNWYYEALKFDKKWGNELPICMSNISFKEVNQIETKCCYRETKRDLKEHFSGRSKLQLFKHQLTQGGSIIYTLKLIKYLFR